MTEYVTAGNDLYTAPLPQRPDRYAEYHKLCTAIAGTDNYDHTLPVSYFVEMLAAERRRKDAENAIFLEALEIIAGDRHCLDTLMGNVDVAQDALRRARQPEPRS